jgi:hypothetical protein
MAGGFRGPNPNLQETTTMKIAITFKIILLNILGSRFTFILIAPGFMVFVLAQRTQVVNPPPDRDYPGGNTAEGQGTLLNLSTGTFNTAPGFFVLRSNTQNKFNTAAGAGALFANNAAILIIAASRTADRLPAYVT